MKAKQIEFERTTHSTRTQFSVPVWVAKELKLKSRDDVRLDIRCKSTGKRLYKGVERLMSGLEIYGPPIRQALERKQRITVTASKP